MVCPLIRASGSPPRAWGGRLGLIYAPLGLRLTPTCVGRTRSRSGETPTATAHPHVRGEDRGPTPRYKSRPAHPHVRGEDLIALISALIEGGSPPRAWGGQPVEAPRFSWVRLTPTCVGRTRSRSSTARRRSAHPHVRGEDRGLIGWPRSRTGSPPRAWGGRVTPAFPAIEARLTPTCVGRTAGRLPGRAWRAAHPHVRGEDGAAGPGVHRRRGSPPRAWGGRRGAGGVRGKARLTPTCVGRTDRIGSSTARAAAHPHVRGEDVLPRVSRDLVAGSPPRAWGGPFIPAGDDIVFRLTPTCVGRTHVMS